MPETIEGILAGRSGRQRNLRRPGGPSFEAIVDETAIYRLTAPPAVMQQQLRHLVDVINGGPRNVTLRVLPTRARIKGFAVPRGTFSIYGYPDLGDPQVVAIEQVISESVVVRHALTCGDVVHASRVRACAYARRPRSRVRARTVHGLSRGYGELSHLRACARASARVGPLRV